MASERRGLRGGGESQEDAPRRPRPRSGPSPLPCPEASTAVGAGGDGELGRARGRPWDSTSRRFGGRWVTRARTDARERGRARAPHAPARSRRSAGTTQAEEPRVPLSRASTGRSWAPARRFAGQPGRPPDEVTGGRPDPDGNGAREPRADPGARPRPPGQAGIGSGSRPGTRGPCGLQTLPTPAPPPLTLPRSPPKRHPGPPKAQAGGSRCPKGA